MNTAFRKATLSIVLMITLLVAVPAWASTVYVFTGNIRWIEDIIGSLESSDPGAIEDILDINMITAPAGEDVQFYARCSANFPDIRLSADSTSEVGGDSWLTISAGAILYLGDLSLFDLDELFDEEPEDVSIDITITDTSITVIIQWDGFFLYFFLSPCSETQGPGGSFTTPYSGTYAVISTAILFWDDFFIIDEFAAVARQAGADVSGALSRLPNLAAAQAHRLPDRPLIEAPGVSDFGQYTLTVSITGESVAAVSQHIPHVGMVMITTSQAQPVYQSPAGQVIRDGAANEIWLPNDANNDGFDTYVVTGVRSVDGEIWLSIYLGSQIWGWVPLDAVTPLSYIPGTD
jgi:hypothetical protein